MELIFVYRQQFTSDYVHALDPKVRWSTPWFDDFDLTISLLMHFSHWTSTEYLQTITSSDDLVIQTSLIIFAFAVFGSSYFLSSRSFS